LFYELGCEIIKPNGLLGFITSNKWMRANYGKPLRNYLIKTTNPYLLIDLGAGVFDSATVDSNILLLSKKSYENNFFGMDLMKEKSISDFTLFENKKALINISLNEIWVLTKDTFQSINEKIEINGLPLKKWNIKINRGLLTGFNEAFIIDNQTKANIIKKDPRSSDIIVPLLRGRDIHRYYYHHQNLFLINTHNGDKNKSRIEIENYPEIKNHLLKYWDNISKRTDQGDTPFNMRNCAYLSLFEEDKIIYPETTVRRGEFVFDNSKVYIDKTCFMITGKSLKYLNAILASRLYTFYLENKLRLVGPVTIQYSKQYMDEVPVLRIDRNQEIIFEELSDLMINLGTTLMQHSTKFITYFSIQYNLDKLPGKLEKWYELEFVDFIKELNKAIKAVKGTPLTKKDEFEWMDLFEENRKKALELKAEIDKTDKEIDQMVYELYGLSDEEIKIVEGS
jgi:hypothetical protein